LQAGNAGEGDAGAVVGIEAFGLDHVLGLQAESAVFGFFGEVLSVGRVGGCGRSRGRSRGGEDVDGSVGEDSVNVKEDDFNFAGAGRGVGEAGGGH
jgi:hypothetical protein